MGTMALQRMLYFDPSRATECEKPTSPILAGGRRGGGGRRWREEGWGEETEEREMGGEEGLRKVGWLGNIHTVQCVYIGMTEIDIQPLTC